MLFGIVLHLAVTGQVERIEQVSLFEMDPNQQRLGAGGHQSLTDLSAREVDGVDYRQDV